MRLLIVSFYFPPYNTMGAVRVGKLAKYLARFGHDVRVIAAAPAWVDTSLPLEIPRERVWCAGRLQSVGWIPFALAAGSRMLRSWRPDVIYASFSPSDSLIVGEGLSRRFSIPWVAEFRDLWTDNPYYRERYARHPIKHWAHRWYERRCLSSMAGAVTVSEPLARVLRARCRAPVLVVLNGYDPEDAPADAGPARRPGEFRIVYTGKVYTGRRDPSPLFAALPLLQPAMPVRVVFYGSGLESVRRAARQHGAEACVETHSRVPYGQALFLQREADLLLLLTCNDPAEEGVLTGKLFEYLGARRPILCVGASDSAAAQLIRQRHAGMASHDPAEIAAFLAYWADAKAREGEIPALPPAVAAGLTREEQARALERFLTGLVGG